jgi:bifunctional non-homologous end joining protein LigD
MTRAELSRVPPTIEPMLAGSDQGRLPDDARYAYEYKWDGYRAVLRVAADGTTMLTSRRGNDFTAAYPELGEALGPVPGGPAVLDGEIVALDDEGRPDFGLLQNRQANRRPVRYLAFDLLRYRDTPLLDRTYDHRRELLETIEPADPTLLAIPPSYPHADLRASGLTPQDLLDIAASHRIEGLMVKARASKYYPGRRTADWLKHPFIHTQEVVIGGWHPGQGRRGGSLGSLLLGAQDPDLGGLRYIGDVGTGFTQQALAELLARLEPLAQPTSPFADVVPRDKARGAHWVRPEIVGEVVYRQFTPGEGRLRHTAWRGLRPDKTPADVFVPSAH